MSTLDYLKNLFTDKNVASVTPSSEYTVKRVCDKIDFIRDNIIVEYGPGDGVFTHYLLEHLSPNSRLIAIETNKGFVELLGDIDDQRFEIIHDSAENIEKILHELNLANADYIISGIPFSFIPKEIKSEIVASTARALGDSGSFLVYQTSKHVLPFLIEFFDTVTDELELKNIPPMVVMEARKMQSSDN